MALRLLCDVYPFLTREKSSEKGLTMRKKIEENVNNDVVRRRTEEYIVEKNERIEGVVDRIDTRYYI